MFGPPSQELLFQLLIEEGRWDDAEKLIKKRLDLGKLSTALNRRYISFLNMIGRRYDANSLVVELLNAGAIDREMLLLLLDPAEPLDARDRAQTALAKYPQQILPQLALANYAMFLQDYPQAIQGFESILNSRKT